MGRKKGICKLCSLEKDLVEAHIFPEHLFKKLYDDDHKFIEVHTKDGTSKTKKRFKGLRDNSILCADCDNKVLGKLDDYASKVFFGYRNMDLQIKEFHNSNDPRVRWRQADNVNSQKIKLFLLSVLWRAHVSTIPFFNDVDLGDVHSDRIRSLISDSSTDDPYEILLLHFAAFEPEAQKFMSKIVMYRKNGRTFYAATMCGLLIIWFVSENSLPNAFKDCSIKSGQPLKIYYSPTQGFEFIKMFIGAKNLSALNKEL